MIKNSTITSLGFNSTELKELKTCLEKSILHVNFEHHYKLADFTNEDVNIEECDVLIVNADSISSRFSEHLSLIRTRVPFSEIILISESENYQFAIRCLRAGVRDILTRPLDEGELKISIENAMTYRLAYKKSHTFSELLSLLNYFGDIRKFTKESQVFYTAYEYVRRGLGGRPFIVYEYNWENLSLKESWKASREGHQYDESKLVDILKEVKFGTETHFWKKDDFLVIELSKEEGKGLIGCFQLDKKYEDQLVDQLLFQMSYLMRNTLQYLKEFSNSRKMTNLAHRDDVTGLYNQRKLYKDLDGHVETADKRKEPFSVIFVDIDHFKNVNDGHGHLVGSHLLVQLAKELKKTLRETDFIYRYGGDEFVIIVPNADTQLAKKISERLLANVKSRDFDTGENDTMKLSLSIGVATYPQDADSAEAILEMADKVMYEAKKKGRGKVCLINEVIQKS